MRRTVSAWSLALLLLAAACTDEPATGPPARSVPAGSTATTGTPGPTSAPSSAPSTTPTTPSTTPTPTASPTEPEPEPDPISMDALIQRRYDGRNLTLGANLGDFGSYTRRVVTFRGDGLTISGIMNVPEGKGPFPVLVLNHGYIEPRSYFPGQGMPREQDYLARQGYVVLHVDYRNHATSSRVDDVDYKLRLPYTVDTINAVKAVKSSKLKFLDTDRVGWLGRSMGGEVTLRALAVRPGLVDAAVVYASTSSLAADNYRQFYRGDGDRAATNRRIARTYGLPAESPAFWRAASARPYFDRVTEPLLVHHGTQDDTCPIGWAESTVDALEDAGVDVTYRTYRGEGHTFEGQWQTSIERTVDFFDDHLD